MQFFGISLALIIIAGVIPMAYADHQRDYSNEIAQYEYENFIVYQTLGVDAQIIKATLVMPTPTIQSDNTRLNVDAQVYLSDGSEWSVGAGTMFRAIQGTNSGTGEKYYDEYNNFFVYFSECIQCGTDFVLYGLAPSEGERTQPTVEVTTENPTDEICFILNPDLTNPSGIDLDYSDCMKPYVSGLTNEVESVSYAGVAASKSFTGNCAACLNSMKAEFSDIATATFRAPTIPIDWDYSINNDSRVFKCFYSKDHIHDFNIDENTVTIGVAGDTSVSGYMCDAETNKYISTLGPKGWHWSNIAGDVRN